MPTGYTDAVSSGEITDLPAFAMRCARAFGALIDMRDEPGAASIPDRLPVNDYYAKALAEWRARLAEIEALDGDALASAAESAHAEATAQWLKRVERGAATARRYSEMLKKVQAWRPPTSDHDGLKEFMIEQLESSIRFDCDDGGAFDPPPVALTPTAWRDREIAKATQRIEINTRLDAEERARVEARQRWLDDLRASLAREEIA